MNPGRRYGLQVTISTPEGIESPALFLNLVRKAPGELPPGSLVEADGTGVALAAAIAGTPAGAAEPPQAGTAAAPGRRPAPTAAGAGKGPPDEGWSLLGPHRTTATREGP